MKTSHKLAASFGTAIVFSLSLIKPSLAGTFRYTTPTTTTLYTEEKVTVSGITFDGLFNNTVFNPFSKQEQTFSGFYKLQSGEMGSAMSIQAVQQSPTDRTSYLEAGLSSIQYLAAPEALSTVPNGFSVLPDMTTFDFMLTPASISNAPTLLSNGWRAETVPEPSGLLMILSTALLGLGYKKNSRKPAA